MPLCSETCSTLTDPQQRWLDREAVLTAGERMIFIRCDQGLPTDIYDPANYTALVAAGTLRLGPTGRFDKQPVEQTTTTIFDGCLQEELTQMLGSPFTFTTNKIACDKVDQYAWMRDLAANYQNYRVMLQRCDGLYYVSNEAYEAALAANFTAPVPLPDDNVGLPFYLRSFPDELFTDNPTEPVSVTYTIFIPSALPIAGITIPGLSDALDAADV